MIPVAGILITYAAGILNSIAWSLQQGIHCNYALHMSEDEVQTAMDEVGDLYTFMV